MKVVIAGATGLVGKELLVKLLQDEGVSSVVSVSRKPVVLVDKKLQQILLPSFDLLAQRTSDLQGDVYFCCLGTTLKTAGSREAFQKVDHDLVVEFARIAQTHKARCFLMVSALGADAHSKIFYNKVKGEAEESVKALGLKSLVILRPSLLIGSRHQRRTAESSLIMMYKLMKPLLPEKISKRAGTEVKILVQRMIQEAKSLGPEIRVIQTTDI